METLYCRRGNFYKYYGDVIQIISVSKLSVRAYNISQEEFIQGWIDAKKIENLPLDDDIIEGVALENKRGFEIKKENGIFNAYFNGVLLREVKYLHQIQNLIDVIFHDG
jgi:hypothetical protein